MQGSRREYGRAATRGKGRHLIRQLALPPSPQGEGFCMDMRHGFPLRGSCPEGTDEVEPNTTTQPLMCSVQPLTNSEREAISSDRKSVPAREPKRYCAPPRGSWWGRRARAATPWRERGSGAESPHAQIRGPGRLLVLFAATKSTASRQSQVGRKENAVENAAEPLPLSAASG